MKRVIGTLGSTVYRNTRSKRPRISNKIVSATSVFNYMNNDTLCDLLKVVYGSETRDRSYSGVGNNGVWSDSFNDYIINKGVEFENKLVKYIHENKVPIMKVSDFISDETCNRVIELMKQGIPIIHSAPVRDYHLGTQGVIDLLVRKDYLEQLIDHPPENSKHIVYPRKLNINNTGIIPNYVVIDIKFSTLPLRSDGINILNTGNYKAYKSQLWIYTQAIGRIQGYTPREAYIIGRRWKYTKQGAIHSGDNALSRIGVINYSELDKDIPQKTVDAIDWVRCVKSCGEEWSVNPPSRPELYPNMCIDSGLWQPYKQQIAEDLGEITTVWNLGVKHRNIGISNGIKSWRNKKCNTENLGCKPGATSDIIDKILDVNRQNTDIIRPKYIRSIPPQNDLIDDLYVDFETLTDIFTNFSELPRQPNKGTLIFMIGVGKKCDRTGEWSYTRYTCKEPTLVEQYRIMSEFIRDFITPCERAPRLHYWSAENRLWSGTTPSALRAGFRFPQLNWCDMHKLFINEPIVIQGCFKYGLKQVAGCMVKHGLINTQMTSDCTNGMSAMIRAAKCYENNHPDVVVQSPVMSDIATYNEYDCRVLYDILKYLRENHSNLHTSNLPAPPPLQRRVNHP